jgi:predicted nuclease of restriction endonuclease-like RecB superfamily
MLTGDLVRVSVVKKNLVPRFVDPASARLLERAETLISLMDTAVQAGWNRGEISAQLRDIEGVDTDHKITKGLAKLLLDKGEWDTISPIDPAELRQRVFVRAAAEAPLARNPGPTGRRVAADVLAAIAAELDTTEAVVTKALYADLKDENVLIKCALPSPEGLLHRYNTALVQAVLLKATWLRVELTETNPKYVRQLMRFLKFHQLMYRIESQNGLTIQVDGPQSLLKSSTRYGMQLANFFPAVLLQPGEWQIEAEVLWGRKRKFKKRLCVGSALGIRSHYKDTGTWTSRTETWFTERWAQHDSAWALQPGEPIDMGGQAMMVPDFTFKKGKRVGHLEIVGFWRKGYLEQRLARLPDNVILAVSSRLAGETGKLPSAVNAQIIQFAEVIPPKKVVDRLEQIAR